ncbi:uncharacterized protein LOC133741772 isoform X2 [Rosa rugosa]|uniref:uncharacterized protein LOC133741772 isoform X2 n=1 Tax=Rosa rugosa TaxID=74645 RepID=UPI002B415ED6|nr:uncharacterized protein LOC133741772 isoform X2 [Rosa rugosa]
MTIFLTDHLFPSFEVFADFSPFSPIRLFRKLSKKILHLCSLAPSLIASSQRSSLCFRLQRTMSQLLEEISSRSGSTDCSAKESAQLPPLICTVDKFNVWKRSSDLNDHLVQEIIKLCRNYTRRNLEISRRSIRT